jgi:hypothetical protein
MTKPILPHWKLAALVETEFTNQALGEVMIPFVHPVGDVMWDEECPLGRAAWGVRFIAPEGRPAQEIIMRVREVVANLQQRYDLGLRAP